MSLLHLREVFHQLVTKRDCNSSLKRPIGSFVEVSGFSFSGSHPCRGHQRHSGRREARFSEMQCCTKQRKSPSLGSFQAVYAQMTTTKRSIIFISGGLFFFNLFSNSKKEQENFFSVQRVHNVKRWRNAAPAKDRIGQ